MSVKSEEGTVRRRAQEASSSPAHLNPLPFMNLLKNKNVVVKLKWGTEYHGTLLSLDQFMNLELTDVDEYINDTKNSHLGDLLIRCNNVLYVHEIINPS